MGNPLSEHVEPRANAFGRHGWELVAIDAGVWVFKRLARSAAAQATELAESARADVEEAVPLAEARRTVPILAEPILTELPSQQIP